MPKKIDDVKQKRGEEEAQAGNLWLSTGSELTMDTHTSPTVSVPGGKAAEAAG